MSEYTNILPDEPEPYQLIIYLSRGQFLVILNQKATENGGSVFSLDVRYRQQYHPES